MYNEVKDSGERTQYNTGAQRDRRSGKGRYDLIPTYALKRLAQHYENGAVKYGDNNWKKGIPLKDYYDSAMRHLTMWMSGENDEDHLAAVLFNVMAIIETEQMIKNEELPTSLLVEEHQKTKKPPKNTTIPANNARLEINGQHINNTWDGSSVFAQNMLHLVASGVYNPVMNGNQFRTYNAATYHSLFANDLFGNDMSKVSYDFDGGLQVNNGDTLEYPNANLTEDTLEVKVTRANGQVEYHTARKSGHADQHKKGNK